MKLVIAIVSICAWSLCQYTQAKEVQMPPPRWVIVATIIKRATGVRLEQHRLPGTELEFEDAAACNSVINHVLPVRDDDFEVVLTCRKVGPTEGDL